MKLVATKGKVLVTNLERGIRMVKGFIIPDDNGKSEGIRPRWAKVYAVGSDITDIAVGQWILIENGRWTRMTTFKDDDDVTIPIWGVDWPAGAMLVSDVDPEISFFSEFTST